MSIINKLATSLKRRDEEPNIILAKEIAADNNQKAIDELIINLNNKSKDIQHDCIKVLYEVAALKPALLKAHISICIELLKSKNNRLQWGAMSAIDALAEKYSSVIYHALPAIMDAAEKGSVITRDHAVGILIKLSAVKVYSDEAFTLLMEQLKNSPPNQLPMYAENTLPLIDDKNKSIFVKILHARINDIEKESKRKRIEKIIKKLKA